MSQTNMITAFPDNNEPKMVEIQAKTQQHGPRHVMLQWDNDRGPVHVTQIIHLVGIPGAWHFDSNVAKLRSPETRQFDQIFQLGVFTRAQRDRIIQLASGIKFKSTSTTITCRAWMHALLQAMVSDPVVQLSQAYFDWVNSGVPLIPFIPEA